MPAVQRKKALASPPPNPPPRGAPARRKRVWWIPGIALLIATGLRLASTDAGRRWRYERQSIDALHVSAEQRPGDPVLHLVLGRKLLAAGRTPEALEECRRAVALSPASARAWAALGQAMAAAGQDDDAFAALQASLAHGPTAEALATQGQLYLSHHVPEKAVPVLEQAVRIAPNDADAWRRLAEARAALGQWSAADAAWARLGSLRPEEPDALSGRAEALIQLGRPAEAEPFARTILQHQPRSAAAHALRGAALAARSPGSPFDAGAEGEFREALRLSPGLPSAADGLALLLLREGRNPEALALLADLLRRAPDSLRARFEYARALRAVGRTVEADRALQEYHRRAEMARLEMELRGRLTLRPNDPVLRARLARLLRGKRGASDGMARKARD
jgi:Flp pilus assembly protein TadD